MPAKAGIQVTDSVRHTVGKLVPYCDTGRYPGDHKAWIPAFAGMTENEVDFESTSSKSLGFELRVA